MSIPSYCLLCGGSGPTPIPCPHDLRMAAKAGDINAFGEYTVQHWFSSGDPDGGSPHSETYAVKGCGRSLTIMALGIAGEVGEVVEKIKKVIRDGTFDAIAIKKELGDVLFYWARICRYFGFEPSEIIACNIDKLDDRRARGVSRGSGDNR